jgi:hypothetical protein
LNIMAWDTEMRLGVLRLEQGWIKLQ